MLSTAAIITIVATYKSGSTSSSGILQCDGCYLLDRDELLSSFSIFGSLFFPANTRLLLVFWQPGVESAVGHQGTCSPSRFLHMAAATSEFKEGLQAPECISGAFPATSSTVSVILAFYGDVQQATCIHSSSYLKTLLYLKLYTYRQQHWCLQLQSYDYT